MVVSLVRFHWRRAFAAIGIPRQLGADSNASVAQRTPSQLCTWLPSALHGLPLFQQAPQPRRIDIEQIADVFEGEWAVAWRSEEPLASFVEITPIVGPRLWEVRLKKMHSIYQDSEGQPAKGLHPRNVPAM